MALMATFNWPPTPRLLQWLSGGHWGSRLVRSQRLYHLLHCLYGRSQLDLPQPFTYKDLAQRLFAPSHGLSDKVTLATLQQHCQGTTCLCQQTGADLMLKASPLERQAWIEEAVALTGLGRDAIAAALEAYPFAVVHRAIRTDGQGLCQQGWLRQVGRGQFARVPADQWPSPPIEPIARDSSLRSQQQQLTLLRALESIAFVQPELAVIVDDLWQQVFPATTQRFQVQPPSQRIFIHLDYILSDDMQEQVDSYQQQIEALWKTSDGGVIQFDNWVARQQRTATVTVYPVCLHYARRAKYLSAYGQDPDGHIGWHNYRLDRIRSPRIRVLPWGDPAVPAALKTLRNTGQLPTPAQVQIALDEAWGFNFYLPKALLIMRFPAEFAREYVQDTERHPTFRAIAYGELEGLVRTHVADLEEQAAILLVLAQRSTTDAYFWGWIRLGDINVTMRLRDWRPQGEVIAPLVMRQQMKVEATRELDSYGVLSYPKTPQKADGGI